jgi:hypothetical protein
MRFGSTADPILLGLVFPQDLMLLSVVPQSDSIAFGPDMTARPKTIGSGLVIRLKTLKIFSILFILSLYIYKKCYRTTLKRGLIC